MNPRLRRLYADRQAIRDLFANHPRIRLLEEEGEPPEKYTFEYDVRGLLDETLRSGSKHRAEIFLALDYPRRPPFCRMITPVFHPNIEPSKICIGDHWSANQSLAELVVRIGEMICYQSYNVKSPLNAKAAAWAEQHQERLPLDNADLVSWI